jgi:hypothetical protein
MEAAGVSGRIKRTKGKQRERSNKSCKQRDMKQLSRKKELKEVAAEERGVSPQGFVDSLMPSITAAGSTCWMDGQRGG